MSDSVSKSGACEHGSSKKLEIRQASVKCTAPPVRIQINFVRLLKERSDKVSMQTASRNEAGLGGCRSASSASTKFYMRDKSNNRRNLSDWRTPCKGLSTRSFSSPRSCNSWRFPILRNAPNLVHFSVVFKVSSRCSCAILALCSDVEARVQLCVLDPAQGFDLVSRFSVCTTNSILAELGHRERNGSKRGHRRIRSKTGI